MMIEWHEQWEEKESTTNETTVFAIICGCNTVVGILLVFPRLFAHCSKVNLDYSAMKK